MTNNGLMNQVLSGSAGNDIENIKENANRYIDQVYPKPDVNKAKQGAIKDLLGAAIGGGLLGLVNKDAGAAFAAGGAQHGMQRINESQKAEMQRRMLFDRIFNDLLKEQGRAYLYHEQNADRANRWKTFAAGFDKLMEQAPNLSNDKLSSALMQLAANSGLDEAQLGLVTKVMGVSSKLASNPEQAKVLWQTLQPGAVMLGINQATGDVVKKYENPKMATPADMNDRAQLAGAIARLRKQLTNEAIQMLGNDPRFAGYMTPLGGMKPDTPENIRKDYLSAIESYVDTKTKEFLGGNVGGLGMSDNLTSQNLPLNDAGDNSDIGVNVPTSPNDNNNQNEQDFLDKLLNMF